MKLHIQRWTYRDGNHTIRVENAYCWNGWAQERLVVDGEQVQTKGAWFATSRDFNEPWLTRLGDTQLEVRLQSGLMKIHADVRIDGRVLTPESMEKFVWEGAKGAWPPAEG